MDFSELIHKSVLVLLELGILLGSVGTVSFVNTANSAFSLGLVFTCISLLYLVSNADFIAAAQLLVYVGAINILIVFAVMITDDPTSSDVATATLGFEYFTPLGLCTILFVVLTCVIYNTEWFDLSIINDKKNIISSIFANNVKELGYEILTEFLVPFELVSILLLVALVGAINPARNENRFIATKEVSVSLPRDNSSFF
uniref:NAD(P)H-quinone oxidoreductase subunit 6, chloroplastic n=1 Tax=Tryonia myriophylla TaxID=170584 RepID=A0A3G5CR89_9MONI|nr:NADH-plastoquinone oxidoreductase subunit 6 [Tryonia myriophylla]AYW15365.1 NADH-plastoquinone oxidoreductase subunit 6 [Tryonia myriophylla]